MSRLACRRRQGFVLVPVVLSIALIATIAFLMNRESGMDVELVASEARSAQADYAAEAGFHHANWLVQSSDCSGYTNIVGASLGDHTYDAAVTPSDGTPVTIISTGTLADGTTRTITRTGIAANQPPATVVLQPGADGKDTFVQEKNGDKNQGTADSVSVESSSTSDLTLLEFSLADIPAGAHIASAQLSLCAFDNNVGPGAEITVYRITQPWTEDGATYQTSDGTTAWTWPDNYDAGNPATTAAINPGNGWKNWNVTGLVDAWHRGQAPNYGMLLAGNNEVYYVGFHSSEYDDDPTLRPKLTVTYACECGVDCGGMGPAYCDPDSIPSAKVAEFSTSAYGSGNLQGLTYLPEGKSFNSTSVPVGGAWLSVDFGSDKFYLTDMAGGLLTQAPTPSGTPTGVALVASGAWADHLAVSDQFNDEVHYVDLGGTHVTSFSTNVSADFDSNTPGDVAFIGSTASGTYDGHLAISDHGADKVYLVTQNGAWVSTIDTSSFSQTPQGMAHIPGSDKLVLGDAGGAAFIVDFNGNLSAQYDTAPFGTDAPKGIAVNPLTCEHVLGDDTSDLVVTLNAGTRVLFVSGGDVVIQYPSGESLVIPTAQEQARIDLMESWGFSVNLIDDNATQAEFDVEAAPCDVAYISQEMVAASLGTKLVNTPIGVVNESKDMIDEFGFATGLSMGGGLPTLNVDPDHYITSVFAVNPVAPYAANEWYQIADEPVAPGVDPVGAWAVVPWTGKPALMAIPPGGQLISGGSAAGRRVQIPWGAGQGATPVSLDSLSDDARTIIRRSLEWAAGAETAGTGPIAHWKLDETSGPTAVDSVGGHDGTWTNDPSWALGTIDGGLSFDGSNDYVNVPHAETLSLTGGMTFSAWANTLETGSGYKAILAKDIPGNGLSNYWFGTWNDELVFGFFAEGGFRVVATPSSNLQPGTWYHLAASFDDDADEVRLYVDGVEAHVGALTYIPTTETADLWIGHSVDGEYWHGTLDDIRIYNTVLSAADVTELAKAGGSPVLPGTTVTLTPTLDTQIRAGSPYSFGGSSSMVLTADYPVEIRPLVQFNVSGVPSGATVTAATLRLYNYSAGVAGSLTAAAHRVTEEWDDQWGGSPSGANWLSRLKKSTWSVPGVTFDASWQSDTTFDTSAVNEWVEWDITPLVQEWVDGVSANYGVVLVPGNTGAAAYFHTVDSADNSLYPQLVVTYGNPVAPL